MSFDLSTVRLILHLGAVCVWVGGQIVMVALLPALRKAGPEVPKAAANQFNSVAWPAFGIALLSGFWMLMEQDVDELSTGYQSALLIKLLLVALSGGAAFAHAQANTKPKKALWGSLSGLSALAALVFGAILATSI